MTLFNTTTQNLSYSPTNTITCPSQPPTELHNLHFYKRKWCSHIKLFSDNSLWKHMKSIQIYLSINTNTQKVFIMKSISPTYPSQPPIERHDLFIDTWLKYILKRGSMRIPPNLNNTGIWRILKIRVFCIKWKLVFENLQIQNFS
jgi:hypothetical protein